MNQIVKTITVRGESYGIEKLDAQLRAIGVQAEEVTTQTDRMSAGLSRLRGSLDPAWAATQRYERAQAMLQRALDTGRISQADHMRLLDLAAQKHLAAESAVQMHSRALAANGTTSRMAAFQQRNLLFQLNDIGVSLAGGMNPLMVLAQQGSQIAAIYGPEEGGVRRALQETGKMAVSAAASIGRFAAAHPAAIAATVAFGLGLRSVVGDLQAAGHETIGYGDVVVAAMHVAASGVYSFFKPAIDFIGPYVGSAWDWIAEKTKWLGNTAIGLFVGAKNGIIAAWQNLPAALGDLVVSGANLVIGNVEWMVNRVIDVLNGMSGAVNAMIDKLPEWAKAEGAGIGMIEPVAVPRVANPYASTGGVSSAFREALQTDYLGQFGNAVKAKAVANSLAEIEGAAKTAGGALKKLDSDVGDPFRRAADSIRKAQQAAADFQRDTARGFLDDVLGGLRNGESLWKSFGNAAVNALDKIADKLLDQAFAGMFGGGGSGGGLAGGLSGALGFLFNGFQGFAGGGFTGHGSRSGGMDGQGGFLAMLHPNETVVDHHRGQSLGGTSISIGGASITINGNADSTTLAEIKREIARSEQRIKASVVPIVNDAERRRLRR